MGNKTTSSGGNGGDIIETQQKNNICQIYLKYKDMITGIANGFFCMFPYPDKSHFIPVLVCVHRSLNENNLILNSEIELTLENDKKKKIIKLDKNRKVYINQKLDVTVIEIRPKTDKIESFLELDSNLDSQDLKSTFMQTKLYFICYGGQNKMDKFTGNIKNIEGETIYYMSDIASGSGGCPIMNSSNHKVIGVHLGRTPHEYKKGLILKSALEEFSSGKFNTLKEE